MKKYLLLGIGIFAVSMLSAQNAVRNANGSVYKKCARFAISEPLWKIAKEHPSTGVPVGIKEAGDSRAPGRIHSKRAEHNVSGVDPVIQAKNGALQNLGTIQSFDGTPSTQGYVPLDPNGMIGSNYYFQTVNSNYAIWSKTGTNVISGDLASLFGAFTCNDGDPVTMYDKFADRWIISEFQENDNPCGSNPFSSLYDTMMFAVSVTNNPTGSYYLYYFCPDNADFADYPKYTIWADGYYETCNCQNDKVVVYDRTKMLAGNPAAGFIVIPYNYSPETAFNPTCAQSGGFYCPMTMYADGTLPPYGTPNYLLDFTDPNWGSCWAINSIRIFQVSVDWTLNTGALSLYQTLPTAAFNSLFNGRNSIDQPSGNTQSLDALDGFFSYRIPYMRWSSYNSAVMCNPVNIGKNTTSNSNMSGVRWYELRQDTGTKLWSIFQQGTYAPNDQVSRWNPGIAMDQNGSIGLEYSASDPSSTYPSLYFTGRRACDTLGTMTLAEGTAVAGNSVVNTFGRWGDYSHLSVDPTDGITFWGTNSYGNGSIASSALATRIFSFQIPKCVVGMPNINGMQAELNAYQSGSQLNVKGVKLPDNESVSVELYDVNGKRILAKSMSTGSGIIETSFNVSAIAKGAYFVRIGNDSFLRVVKLEIQ